MKILVTGAEGFIGRNLVVRLEEGGHTVFPIGRSQRGDWAEAIATADIAFHLAGVNRPTDEADFVTGNTGTTEALCASFEAAGRPVPIVYASSSQAEADNPYGNSKRAAEEVLLAHAHAVGAPVAIYRLPNVFGKWARPNYNSAVATFCHRIARGEQITVHDAAAPLRLTYIDDVIDTFLALLGTAFGTGFREVATVYETTVGEVARIIGEFPESRRTLVSPRVGTGLTRALYSTYLSHLPTEDFAYAVPIHADPRGRFVEMLKTPDAGQFSYFTAGPGITRGGHYHHTKAEKFLVVSGRAHFGFRHIVSGETREFIVEGTEGRIVETIPGWTHDITNIGTGELVVMLWANEIFDRARPDTIAMKV